MSKLIAIEPKTRENFPKFTANIQGKQLTIRSDNITVVVHDISRAHPSSTGKTMLLYTSHGTQYMKANPHPIAININVYQDPNSIVGEEKGVESKR